MSNTQSYGVLVPPTTSALDFVLFSEQSYSSPKEHELRIAQVKSHAARTLHKTRQLPTSATSSEPVPRWAKRNIGRFHTFSSTPLETASPNSIPPASSSSTPSDNEGTSRPVINGKIDFLHGEKASHLPTTETRSAVQWHWLGGGTRTDPFRCIPGLDEFGAAGKAFDWLCQYVSPNVAAICEPFGVSNLYGRWLLEQMAIYLDVFHVMMAALHDGLVALTSPEGPHRSYALMHKGWALQALRRRLAAADAWVDDSAILTML